MVTVLNFPKKCPVCTAPMTPLAYGRKKWKCEKCLDFTRAAQAQHPWPKRNLPKSKSEMIDGVLTILIE